MMSITAALEKLNKAVGGGIANFQTGKGFCLEGIRVSTKYENAAIINNSGIKNEKITNFYSVDVDLNEAIKYANVGDIVYIRVSGDLANQVKSGSGYHATTHIGGGKIISFNSDGLYNSPSSFKKNPKGVIIRTSEIIRQRLKKNPNAKIDKEKLIALANGAEINVSLVNYQGGAYSSINATNVSIPEITYTGPTNILPKSVMNSLLNALRIITNTTAENMVLGNVVMCYSTMKKGGTWLDMPKFSIPNLILLLQGLVILIAGFMLTVSIGFYFLDISFKVGFCVLALPITVGLWPFEKTKDKVMVTLSILMKASASFAFMALITSYGMSLVSESLNDLSDLYEKIEKVPSANDDARDQLNEEIKDRLGLFSSTFLMMIFAMFYFFKLVSKTIDSFVNKFFPDNVFGDKSPMHETATKAVGKATNIAKTVTGFNLAKDIAKHQLGQRGKNIAKKFGNKVGGKVGTGISKGAKKVAGWFK